MEHWTNTAVSFNNSAWNKFFKARSSWTLFSSTILNIIKINRWFTVSGLLYKLLSKLCISQKENLNTCITTIPWTDTCSEYLLLTFANNICFFSKQNQLIENNNNKNHSEQKAVHVQYASFWPAFNNDLTKSWFSDCHPNPVCAFQCNVWKIKHNRKNCGYWTLQEFSEFNPLPWSCECKHELNSFK